MYLFFDTETTGLPIKWDAPLTDFSNWPRLVQLAFLYYDKSENLTISKNYIIEPEGFEIPTAATKIHGISTKVALEKGQKLRLVLKEFQELINNAQYIIGHNLSFDEKIISVEFLRLGMVNPIRLKNRICTMDKTKSFCAIPGDYGYKWPKLSELHNKLFGVGFDEAHDAAVDIAATARCFWELKRQGVLVK